MSDVWAAVEIQSGVLDYVYVHRTKEDAVAEAARLARESGLEQEGEFYWTDGENDVLVRYAEMREDPWVLLENFGAVTEKVTIFPSYAEAEQAATDLAQEKNLSRNGVADYWTDEVDTDVYVLRAEEGSK